MKKTSLIWMVRNMITQRIDDEEEFLNPNINYDVLMSKLKNRILDLEEDVKNIKDPIIRGYALKDLVETRERYFDYLKIDLELQHLVLSNPDIYNKGGDE